MKFAKENSFSKGNESAIASVDQRAVGNAEDSTVYLDMDKLKPNSKNEYKMSDIEKLSSMIKLSGGIWQNIIVMPADEEGYYTITTGERRWRAAKLLRSRGEYPEKFGNRVPCIIRDLSEIDLPLGREMKEEFAILVTNQYRTKTDGELFMEMKKWREIIGELRKAGVESLPSGYDDGEDIQVKGTPTRKLIADQLGVSTGQVSRLEQVERHGSEALVELLMSDKVDLSTAEKLVKLKPDTQTRIIKKAENNSEINITDQIKESINKENKITLKREKIEEEIGTILSAMADDEILMTEGSYKKYQKALGQLRKVLL